MQHNVHAARPAPHLRAHHHTHGHTHMQMHPSLEQHLAAAASMAGAPQMQPQQQPTPHRDHHHPRLNHHHLHAQQQQQQTPSNPAAVAVAAGPAYHHNSNISSSSSSNNNNQMQKIRQQHQHLSSSNGHVGKCQQPPPQAYNPLAGNPAALSYNPLPPPPPPHHMAAHIGGYAAHPPHYYQMSQPKPPSKYNNNNNPGGHYIANSGTSNGYGSKAILQPTYRSAKVGPVLAPAMVPEAVAASATAASSAAAAEHPECVSSSNLPGATEPAGLEELPPSDQEPSATETAATAVNEGCSTEQIDASGTLSNEDGSSGRSGKDKTPMCLVNELARYNKITHQYRLTGERGPAHCKTFTVTLKLGDEEYSADGFKIKKAQHMAASRAIEETKYKHPPPKIRRSEEASTTRTHITPTVELNALAMKLGQRTYYLLDPTQMQPTDPLLSSEYGGGSLLPTPPPGMPQPMPQPLPPPFALRPARHGHSFVPIQSPPMHPHGFYGGPQRAYGPKYASRYTMVPPLGPHMIHGPNMPYAPIPPTPSKITLYVGKQKFVGIGRTLQQAKHDAAARALQVLKTQASSASEEALDDSMDEGDKKSPISQVHEIGIKRNMTVHFKVLREDGPAHMKNFITACVVGSIVTEGEGNGKKVSKKRSAEKMLTELQKLPPLTPTKQTPVRRIKVKTPGKNGSVNGSGTTLSLSDVVSMAKPERRKRLNVAIRPVELDDAENPITKLIQLQQTRKEKEPIFELIAKNGNEASRRREFVMEVSANGTTARGTGSSKKLAKRSAAQALLELLESDEHSRSVGVQESQDSTDGNATEIATATATSAPVIESTVDPDIPMVSTPVGPMPGILILRQHKRPPKRKVDPMIIVKDSEEAKEEEEANKETSTTTTDDNSGEPQPMETAPESTLNTSTGSNTSGVSSNSSNAAASSSAAAAVHMKEQLLYLSKLFEFEVNFSDYPKGNHNEFLTIVTLSTNPPQICHGVGKSSDESQNDAARNALKILSELGLNNAKK